MILRLNKNEVDKVCGAVHDFDLPKEKLIIKTKGFISEQQKIILMGKCKKCK